MSESIGIIACTAADIHEAPEMYCYRGRGEHSIECKAHCLEYGHEPTACVMEPCCEEAPL